MASRAMSKARKMGVVLLLEVCCIHGPPARLFVILLEVAGVGGGGEVRFYGGIELAVVEGGPVDGREPGVGFYIAGAAGEVAEAFAGVYLEELADDVFGVCGHGFRVLDFALDDSVFGEYKSSSVLRCGDLLLVDLHGVLVPERRLAY